MLRKEADLQQILDSTISSVQIDTSRAWTPWPIQPGTGLAGLRAGPPEPGQERTSTGGAGQRQAGAPGGQRAHPHPAGRCAHGPADPGGALQPVVTQITESICATLDPGDLCRIREADTATFQHSVSSCALLICSATT